MEYVITLLIIALSVLAGWALGYWHATRQRPTSAPAPMTAAPPSTTSPRQVFCRIRIIGDRVFHSHCRGCDRFDDFTLPAPGEAMKDTGHWVTA